MSRVLVTGANRGIGLELCRQLLGRGTEIIAVCRQSSSALDGLNVTVVDGVNVADAADVQSLSGRLGNTQIDWLINNAGILSREGVDDLDHDAIERQFRVNSMGPLRVTQALLPNLLSGSKVGIITSRMGSIEDNTSGGYYGYRMSKAAVNIAGVSLAHDLQPKGIAVALLHPGMVATDMTNGSGVSVSHAAAGLIQRMDELNLENSGSFWHAEGQNLPW